MKIEENIDKIVLGKKCATDSFIRTAVELGTKICKQAHWSGPRCNWIGKTINTTDSSIEGSYTIENRALGPSLYEGTSGIALFLSYLYLHKKSDEYYDTAIGAINQALSLVEEIPLPIRFGFYTGKIGVAYAATKIGTILSKDSLHDKAMKVLMSLELEKQDDHLNDLISGNAGAIPALLHMYYSVFHDQKVLDLALQLGNELINTAVKDSNGWSWTGQSHRSITQLNTSTKTGPHNLTGFSHGTAGMAYGLLELFNKTDKKEFLHGARQAISYENHWYNPERKNWPDFRNVSEDSTDAQTKRRDFNYSTSWCHGAPGIGLSRQRAYEILKEESYLNDLQACVQTSAQLINNGDSDGFAYSQSNYSLCHGLSGICELLICSNELIKDESYRSLPVEVGIRGIEQYANNNLPWPCGIPEGEPQDLMLGLSGIGYFYLRLCDPVSTPSILMVTA